MSVPAIHVISHVKALHSVRQATDVEMSVDRRSVFLCVVWIMIVQAHSTVNVVCVRPPVAVMPIVLEKHVKTDVV